MRHFALFLGAVALAGSAASLPAQSRRDRDREREYESRIDTTFALARGAVVELGLISGDIVVTGSDRNEVRIRAYSERGTLQLDVSSARVSLDVRARGGRVGDTRYEVQLPAGTRVLARAVSGDIDIRGVRGDVEARSVSGDLDIDDVGQLRFESVSGDVKAVRIAGPASGSSVSGEIELADVGGDVRVESTSGDIYLDGIRARIVRAETVSGGVRFTGSVDRAGRYEFTAHSGDIRLALPDDVGATVGLETFSGDIESAFPLVMNPTGRRGRSERRFEFTLGGGGARITATTFSGNIDLERGTGRATTKE